MCPNFHCGQFWRWCGAVIIWRTRRPRPPSKLSCRAFQSGPPEPTSSGRRSSVHHPSRPIYTHRTPGAERGQRPSQSRYSVRGVIGAVKSIETLKNGPPMSRLAKLMVTLGAQKRHWGAVFERLDTFDRTGTTGMRRFLRRIEVFWVSRRQNPVLIYVAACGIRTVTTVTTVRTVRTVTLRFLKKKFIIYFYSGHRCYRCYHNPGSLAGLQIWMCVSHLENRLQNKPRRGSSKYLIFIRFS